MKFTQLLLASALVAVSNGINLTRSNVLLAQNWAAPSEHSEQPQRDAPTRRSDDQSGQDHEERQPAT